MQPDLSDPASRQIIGYGRAIRLAPPQPMKPATISLAAVRAMLEVMEAYVPMAQREAARAAALAVGIGYAES